MTNGTISRKAARLPLGLSFGFLALLTVLHVLEPEFNSGHLMSEYQRFCSRSRSLTGQMDTPLPLWVSLANRFLVVTYCIWFVVAAWSATCKQQPDE